MRDGVKAKTDKAALELVRSFRQAVREGDVWVMRFAAECIAECMCRFSFLLILDVSRYPEPGTPCVFCVFQSRNFLWLFIFAANKRPPTPQTQSQQSNKTPPELPWRNPEPL